MTPADTFALLAAASDLPDRLDEAALALAAARPGGADVEATMHGLDRLAESVREPSMAGVVAAMDDLGFHGNRSEYYDATNSFLDRVVEKRTGIPITLAIVAISVGRRIGVPIVGVGMPAHFLIGSPDGERFADPFNGLDRLDPAACANLFERVVAPGTPFRPEFLQPTPPVQILRRVLNNLIVIHGRTLSRADLVWSTQLRSRLPDADDADRRAHADALAGAGQFDRAADEFDTIDPSDPADAARAIALRSRLN